VTVGDGTHTDPAMAGGDGRDVYERLGVRPVINGAGVHTVHGNSIMLPEVEAAMNAAVRHFVLIDELMEAASRRLAELTGAEAGIVTAGSAAALSLAAAACVAGNDPDKMLALPEADGMKRRVLIPANQRFAYDHAIRLAGCVMVTVDNVSALEAEMHSGGVAMICVLAAKDHAARLTLKQIAPQARRQAVPVVVDAASEFPESPDLWLTRGADLVIYSGGKYLRGPASSGLLLGKRDLVAAAWANAAPHQAIGRPMKISKEQIIGALAAVEHWFARRDPRVQADGWNRDLATIARAASAVDGVTAERQPLTGSQRVPRLRLRWQRSKVAMTGLELRARLLEGKPRILLDDIGATDDSILIDPFGLQPGDAAVVSAALRRLLSTVAPEISESRTGPAMAVSGTWSVLLRFLHGSAQHEFRIEQKEDRLSGWHKSASFGAMLEEHVTGNRLFARTRHPRDGVEISYRFDGAIARGTMAGTFRVGSSGEANRGPVADEQFGGGEWTAACLEQA